MAHLHWNCATLVFQTAPYPHDCSSHLIAMFSSAPSSSSAGGQTSQTPSSTVSSQPSSGLGGFFSAAATVASQLKSTVDKKLYSSRVESDKEAFAEHFYSHLGAGGLLLCGTRCSIVSAGVVFSGRLFVSTQAVCFIQRHGGGDTSGGGGLIKEIIPLDDIVSFLPSVSLPVGKQQCPVIIGVPSSSVVPNALQIYTKPPLKQIFQLIVADPDEAVSLSVHPKALPESLVQSLQTVRHAVVKLICALESAWLSRRTNQSKASATPPSPSAADGDRPAEEEPLFAPPHF